MRKLFSAVVLLFFLIPSLKAQHKFFQSVQLTPYWYFDDVFYKGEDWKKQFQAPSKPLAQNFDSLSEIYPREWGFRIKGGAGMQLRAQRILPVFRTGSRSRLEWSPGIGHRSFGMKTYPYGSYYPVADTTKQHLFESETFQLRQDWVDLYNSIVYSLYSKRSSVHVFIGFGFQASLTFSSRINETYHSDKADWNTAQHRWVVTSSSNETRKVRVKNSKALSYTIPMGWGVSLSRNLSWESSIEIFHSWRGPHFGNNFSDGIMFQSSFRYKL